MPNLKVNYLECDLFDHVPKNCKPNEFIFLCHVTNCRRAWGAGFVVPLGKRYPKARQKYLDFCDSHVRAGGNPLDLLGKTQFVEHEGQPLVTVCNMCAQDLDGKRPLFYNHLAACMTDVAKFIGKRRPARIVAPFFGSALAGGNWVFIQELIQDCWLSKDIPVTICYRKQDIPPGFLITII